jgi:Diacylglycerol kinase catalytic domain
MLPIVALISNPRSTRQGKLLPRIRQFVAHTPNLFHVELHDLSEVTDALKLVARVSPTVLVINGGEGTVQAILTAIYHDKPFGHSAPPIAILPNNNGSIVARDLSMTGPPLKILARLISIAANDCVAAHTVTRALIALDDGRRQRAVIGHLLGAGRLKNNILFCRTKLYPLGLPKKLSHFMTASAYGMSLIIHKLWSSQLTRGAPLRITLKGSTLPTKQANALMVTSMRRMFVSQTSLLHQHATKEGNTLFCVTAERPSLVLTLWQTLSRRLGSSPIAGLSVHEAKELRLEGADASVIMDGEVFEAPPGQALIIRATSPQKFISLAAA